MSWDDSQAALLYAVRKCLHDNIGDMWTSKGTDISNAPVGYTLPTAPTTAQIVLHGPKPQSQKDYPVVAIVATHEAQVTSSDANGKADVDVDICLEWWFEHDGTDPVLKKDECTCLVNQDIRDVLIRTLTDKDNGLDRASEPYAGGSIKSIQQKDDPANTLTPPQKRGGSTMYSVHGVQILKVTQNQRVA